MADRFFARMKQVRIEIVFVFTFLLASCSSSDRLSKDLGNREWPTYQGDEARNQFSYLEQITKDNVGTLEVAWTYTSENVELGERSQMQCNPIVKDGILYGTSPTLKVFALEAATGSPLWEFDPKTWLKGEGVSFGISANRGVALWEGPGEKRILMSIGGWLLCLEGNTGLPIESFGEGGRTSLKLDLGERAQDLHVESRTPGTVFEDLLIMGTRVSENVDAAPGHIRAFDILTGEVAWTFHTIPQKGEYGLETWPIGAYDWAGGANSWAGMSVDRDRAMVYAPTGSASFDFYGGNRVGDNLFANCIIALDARTGERKWHFQTVHHDIWDRDLPAPPNLVTLEIDGVKRDAVAQITKSGHVFVLDRDTGSPLHPVEEMPFPRSDLQGEVSSPTQPLPIRPEPFARQRFDFKDVTNINEEANRYVTGILANLRSDGQFIPPSKEGTVVFPGFDGGGEWGGASVEPETGIMYVNGNEMPWIMTMVETKRATARAGGSVRLADLGEETYQNRCAFCHGPERQGDPTGTFPNIQSVGTKLKKDDILTMLMEGKGFMPSFRQLGKARLEAVTAFLLNSTEEVDPHALGLASNKAALPYSHTGYNRFLDQEGYPAVKPPWGTLNAIDLNKGEILWKVPLGEFEALTMRGVEKTGTENYGGPVATAGGLIFIAATKDEHIRAFDKETGEELWKHKLPAGGYATPSVYEAGERQYVVIACGGGKMGTVPGSRYVAFALPEELN